MRSSPSTGIVAFACTTMLVACAGSAPEGPTDTDVHGAAREHVLQQVTASGIQGEERAAYEAATFSSGARCVPGAEEVYTCELEVTMALPGGGPGDAAVGHRTGATQRRLARGALISAQKNGSLGSRFSYPPVIRNGR